MVGLKSAMGRGTSAPSVGVVDDVVVHERGGLEHLEGRADSDRGGPGDERFLGAGEVGDRVPAGRAEACAEPFSSGEGAGRVLDEEGGLVAEWGDLCASS